MQKFGFWAKRTGRRGSAYQVDAACMTHVGLVRANNEDNYFFMGNYMPLEHGSMEEPVVHSFSTDRPQAVAVFDGMGGENAGEVASFMAAAAFAQEMPLPSEQCSGQYLCGVMERMNHAVCEVAREHRLGQIGTTAVALLLMGDKVLLSNMGDSPAYLLRDGAMELISKIHSDAEYLRRKQITRRKPSLTQFLGIPEDGFAVEPYVAELCLRPGDVFLLCSDGLTDMVKIEDIQRILSETAEIKKAAGCLLEAALAGGGRDNVTLIVCRVV